MDIQKEITMIQEYIFLLIDQENTEDSREELLEMNEELILLENNIEYVEEYEIRDIKVKLFEIKELIELGEYELEDDEEYYFG
jgi:hypothetical protein